MEESTKRLVFPPIGEYWQENVVAGLNAGQNVWRVRTRTGTLIRHCELDAIKSAENAVKELVKYQKKQKESFQKQVEFLMQDMVEYYENLDDVAEDVKMWVGDYVAWTAQEASRP